MKMMKNIWVLIIVLMFIQTLTQSTPEDDSIVPEGENLDQHHDPHVREDHSQQKGLDSHIAGQNGSLSYWEKEFHENAQKFYQNFEVFFVNFLIPVYHMVKESALLTTAVLLILILYITRIISGFFRGDGSTKKFKYNKEEPISYSDLNQHFKNFTKELDDLKQQVKKFPDTQPTDSQASVNPVSVPELEKLTKSLGKTEEHLTKLYQENKQLNQFLASFQREILESHKEIWRELHSLKTARPANSGVKTGERRGQSVSAEDRIPKRLQEPNSRATQIENTHKLRENSSKPFDSELSKTTIPNGTNSEVRQYHVTNDASVNKSQELPPKSSQLQDHLATPEFKPTETGNSLSNPPEKIEQKPPVIQTNPLSKQPGFQKPNPQVRPPIGGAMKQPPLITNPSDNQSQKPAGIQTEQKDETQKLIPADSNPFGGIEKPTTNNTELSTKNETELTNTEEEKSTTTDQTNPEADQTQIPGPDTGAFKGMPMKKPTPVVRNNFAIPQKRVSPVPGNVIKKTPPLMNPGMNFIPNSGSNGPNI